MCFRMLLKRVVNYCGREIDTMIRFDRLTDSMGVYCYEISKGISGITARDTPCSRCTNEAPKRSNGENVGSIFYNVRKSKYFL